MDPILVERHNHRLTLSLNRPTKKNAISREMYHSLSLEINRAVWDDYIHVIVLRGEGETFCSGNDLEDFLHISPDSDAKAGGAIAFILSLIHCDKPIVASVNGAAIGIGATMLLHCDYVILSDTASLSTPFAALGLVPEAAASLLMPANIGHARSFGMFATGDALSATEAQQWGLANRIVLQKDLESVTDDVADRLAALSPAALRATKKLLRSTDPLVERAKLERQVFLDRLGSAEVKAALARFLDSRRHGASSGDILAKM